MLIERAPEGSEGRRTGGQAGHRKTILAKLFAFEWNLPTILSAANVNEVLDHMWMNDIYHSAIYRPNVRPKSAKNVNRGELWVLGDTDCSAKCHSIFGRKCIVEDWIACGIAIITIAGNVENNAEKGEKCRGIFRR